MEIPKPVQNLINALQRLPGIGPKTAKRLTFYLLYVPEEEVDLLAEALFELRKKTVLCEICFSVDEESPCKICRSSGRDKSTICVVESPLDVLAVEGTTDYKGLYHVLHGVISPVNNIGPEDLKINELVDRVKNSPQHLPAGKAGSPAPGASPAAADESESDERISEVIIATNPSMEGESTAMYIKEQLESLNIKITRIAKGLPVGGDLEYADQVTLSHAFEGRTEF
ncbi:MAG: recombination mediator RecR [Patescibacteria group bacterium]|nr:recombination mediator RecR [Patescibacteria group bacterium]